MSGPALWAGIAVAGGVGALARLHVGALVGARTPAAFPWGTMVVNLIAAFLAGLAHGAGVDGTARAVVAVGVLGAFSTFSTWMLDTVRLLEARLAWRAVGNIFGALAAGGLLAAAGWAIGAALWG